jgi:hypothetical protein
MPIFSGGSKQTEVRPGVPRGGPGRPSALPGRPTPPLRSAGWPNYTRQTRPPPIASAQFRFFQNHHHPGERGKSKPNAPPLPVPRLLPVSGAEGERLRHRAFWSGVGQTSGQTVHGASGSVVLGLGKLRASGPANRPTGGLTHPSTRAATQFPCRQGPGAKGNWLENQTPHYPSIPTLAAFRRLGNVTDLRLTIRSRAAGPASVASISSPAIGYLRSTSVWHTEVPSISSGAGPHPMENN